MAVIAATPTNVTNFEATPQKMNDMQHFGAKLHHIEDTVEVATGDDAGDIVPLAWVHKSWSIKDIRIKCDAVNSANDIDMGLYSSADGGTPDKDNLNDADTEGDHDVYGASVDLSSQILVWTSYDNKDPALVKQQVWQDAGISTYAEADEWYLLALTLNDEPAAADTISYQVFFTQPGGA